MEDLQSVIPSGAFKRGGCGWQVVIIGMVVFGLLTFITQFFTAGIIDASQVGVLIEMGQIKKVIMSSGYAEVGWFVDMYEIDLQAVSITAEDPEVITKDKQRVGLIVTADVFRPKAEDIYRAKWAQYKGVFTDDDALRTALVDRAKQAMKVCVGDRNFNDAVVGTARDGLRSCIDTELSKLAENYGLQVDNVVVPDVILSPEVQAALDDIVKERLATEKEVQSKAKAEAQAASEQARQEGEVRVQQARMQEEARQQITLAELEKEKLEANKAVIEAQQANELAKVQAEQAVLAAQKANDLLAAQKELEIQTARSEAAVVQAKADTAKESAVAAIYTENPAYAQYLIAKENASALNETDKVFFTPEGSIPTFVVPGGNTIVDATQQASQN